jgi:hypothetical protein
MIYKIAHLSLRNNHLLTHFDGMFMCEENDIHCYWYEKMIYLYLYYILNRLELCMFNITFNHISVTKWSILLVEETWEQYWLSQ